MDYWANLRAHASWLRLPTWARAKCKFQSRIAFWNPHPDIAYIKDLSVPPPQSCVPIIRKPKLKVIKVQTKHETPTMEKSKKEMVKIPKECEKKQNAKLGRLGNGHRWGRLAERITRGSGDLAIPSRATWARCGGSFTGTAGLSKRQQLKARKNTRAEAFKDGVWDPEGNKTRRLTNTHVKLNRSWFFRSCLWFSLDSVDILMMSFVPLWAWFFIFGKKVRKLSF